ncbi:MAG: metallophosphoesterase [Thermoguttaceae bacterium]|nr:metallophosphoesterase [Thermoguttaceae bacterium]
MFNRRDFLRLSLGVGATAALSQFRFPVPEALAEEAKKELKIKKFVVKVGATKPFGAIHISDTHICLADDRDVERKRNLAVAREKYFGKSAAFFNAAVDYATERDLLLLHTGDLIDFTSEMNYDWVKAGFESAQCPCFCSSGNHEYSHYLGEAKEDDAYKAQSYDRVQKAFPNDLMFASKVVNGVNFVAFDDVYYYVAENLIELFQKEVDKGLPIVAMCHVPFYAPDLFDFMIKDQKQPCAYLTGVSDELMETYPGGRFEQQRTNETTAKFIAWLKEQPLLKAILCGHLHENFDGPFTENVRQYVAGGNFRGDAYEFLFE